MSKTKFIIIDFKSFKGVSNMKGKSGRPVPNQFIIDIGYAEIFQSYQTVISAKLTRTGEVILDKNYWDYSVTTGKYRNQFLGEGIAETRKKIKSGEYKLRDLNK